MESVNNNIFKRLIHKITKGWKETWADNYKPLYLLGGLFFIVLFFVVLYTNIKGGFFHINSDDVLQYYPYINNFFTKLKEGKLSLYDTTLFGGTSWFSGIYYIPLDIFTFVAFILSFIMEAEKAYAITNFLRPACGALLLYYVLARKGMNNKTAFIAGLILFVGGMTESYYIFPVFLGICFYAPLAMLVVDLLIEKKGAYYLLVPLYTVIVIFYDFYIAYMLMAFLCVYFMLEMHIRDEYSFFKKENCIFRNGKFWLRFLEFMALIILGVLMSAIILLPSMLYVMNESSRNNNFSDASLWYFANDKGEISIRHYFTQWINFFIPNEPHRFCLNDAGDYMREHATMYITNGGLIYLAYLFVINGKKENRMKFWIVLINILFAIPLFACIFSFNSVPYVRWFFIPYMINLYGMTIAMNKNDLKVGENHYLNLCPIIFLLLGLGTIIFTLIQAPEYYIHYKREDFFFYPILIGSAICITIYLVLLIISFIFKKKNKNRNILKKVFLGTLFCEVVFAGVMIFCNADDANDYYFNQKSEMTTQKNALYSLGYKDSDGYRIHLDTSYAKNDLNSNILVGNVNFGHFFQSFYNTPLNKVLNDIYNENSTHWGRDFMGGNTLLQAPIFNTKYIVQPSNKITYFPSEYYNELKIDSTGAYFSLADCPQFIVYDSYFTSTAYLNNPIKKEAALLYSAYIYKPALNSDDTLVNDNVDEKRYLQSYNKVVESNVANQSTNELANLIASYVTSVTLNNPTDGSNGTEGWENSSYFYYNISNNKKAQDVLKKDVIYAYANNQETRRINDDDYLMVLNDEQKSLTNFHFTDYFTHDEDIYAFAMKVKDTNNSSYKSVTLYGYDYSLYTNFIDKQNSYTNKYFSLDGSTMTIKCSFPDDKSHIIKTAYTYSNDWKLKNSDYELIDVDGGFLGIIIPEGTSSVNLKLKYEPAGFKTGAILSISSLVIYLAITVPVTVIIIKKRKNKKEVDTNE